MSMNSTQPRPPPIQDKGCRADLFDEGNQGWTAKASVKEIAIPRREFGQILPMRFVAHEHPTDPSACQSPYRACDEVQRGVRRVVIVAKDRAST